MARTGGGLMACRRLASGVTRRPLRFLVAVCRLVLAGSVGYRQSRPPLPTLLSPRSREQVR
jgi:hypothetical protein